MLTPQIKAVNLAKKIGLTTELYLKHEDMHPMGSHKGRSIPFMIDHYLGKGIKNFVISSSGNAALAAALHVKELNRRSPFGALTLTVYIGQKIDKEKKEGLLKLADEKIVIKQVDNPKQQALTAEKSGTAKFLRQSTDDTALAGYAGLAKELAKIDNLSAVFIPSSSGTTAQGLYGAFKELRMNPQIHIVQTTACHPLVDAIKEKTTSTSDNSRAGAIVDKVAFRKNKVVEAVKNSNGGGWIATDEEIMEVIKTTKETERTEISPNSALSLVGLIQALKSKNKFTGPVVCLLTGK